MVTRKLPLFPVDNVRLSVCGCQKANSSACTPPNCWQNDLACCLMTLKFLRRQVFAEAEVAVVAALRHSASTAAKHLWSKPERPRSKIHLGGRQGRRPPAQHSHTSQHYLWSHLCRLLGVPGPFPGQHCFNGPAKAEMRALHSVGRAAYTRQVHGKCSLATKT